MKVIAFDSKVIRREKPDFKALLGVGVTINDYKQFADNYNTILNKVFQDYDLKRYKQVYSSYELLSIFYAIGVDIIPIVVSGLIDHIAFIDLYYSYFLPNFSHNKIKEIKIGVYWEQELKYFSANEFIDLISGAYPAICCHAYTKPINTNMECTFLIDDCAGLRPSVAITNVMKNKLTKFLFKGDQINYAISASDLICKYVDQICLKNNFKLNKDMIDQIGWDKQKVNTTFIGEKWLRDIKPCRDIIINYNHKYPHPIFYFFPDNKGAFENDYKGIIEKSLLYKIAMDKATGFGGSIKFFEASDQLFIEKDDFLLIHNELSKKKIEELKQLSCPAKILDSESIKKL